MELFGITKEEGKVLLNNWHKQTKCSDFHVLNTYCKVSPEGYIEANNKGMSLISLTIV